MAEQANLSATNRLLVLGLMHVQNLGHRGDTYGAITALRMPQSASLLSQIDPMSPTGGDKVAWKKISGVDRSIPTVRYDFRPTNARSVVTTRVHQPTAGTLPNDGSSFTVDFDLYFETEPIIKQPNNFIREEQAQSYIERIKGANLAQRTGILNEVCRLTGSYVQEMYDNIATGIFPALNTALLTRLIANVGKNKAYPTAVTPTAAAPFVSLTGFDANGVAKKDVMEAIRTTKRVNKFVGKPVVIGGESMVKYLANFELLDVNQNGFNYAKINRFADFDFVYDDAIEGLNGAGSFLLLEPNSACLKEFTYTGTQFLQAGRHENTMFTTMRGSIMQFDEDNALNTVPSQLALDFDLRITESISAGAFQQANFIANIAGGTFLRPLGLLTTDSGNILKDITGIYGFKIA